jgi:hypothetical protein
VPRFQPDPAIPARYGPDDPVPPNRLIAGVVVRRRTEPAPGRLRPRVDVPMPCCTRWARVLAGRPGEFRLVVCTSCGLCYEVGLHDENDTWDDIPNYLAVLTVLPYIDVTFARPKPKAGAGR